MNAIVPSESGRGFDNNFRSSSNFEKESSITQVDALERKFETRDKSDFPATFSASEILGHITQVSAESENAVSGISKEELVARIEQIQDNLAPFLVAGDATSPEQIFVMDDEWEHIELEENKPEALSANHEESVWKDAYPAHENAKKYFVTQLVALYGERAVATLYPQEEQEKSLTVGKARSLLDSFVTLQDSVLAACGHDFSKYDACLALQLDKLDELKRAVAHPPATDANDSSYINYFSEQTGIPPYLLQAGVIAGGLLVAGAATGGLGFLPALHAAVATALAHAPTAVVAAKVTGGAPHLAAMMGAPAPSAVSAATVAHINSVGETILAGGGIGALLGGVGGGLATGERRHVYTGAVVGVMTGMGLGALGVTYGPAVWGALSHAAAGTAAVPTTGAVSTGALAGGIGGGVMAAGPSDNPSSTGTIVAGIGAGALLGGLATAFGPLLIGKQTAIGAGVLQGAVGIVRGGREGGSAGALRGGVQGAAAGVALGGAATLFGGACSAIAAHGAVAGGALPIYGEVAGGTLVAHGIAGALSRENPPIQNRRTRTSQTLQPRENTDPSAPVWTEAAVKETSPQQIAIVTATPVNSYQAPLPSAPPYSDGKEL